MVFGGFELHYITPTCLYIHGLLLAYEFLPVGVADDSGGGDGKRVLGDN